MNIVELCKRPAYLATVTDWNLAEWPEPKRSHENVKKRIFGSGIDNALPQTLVIEENNEPIGYATLVLYEKGIVIGRFHWIDAVYVIPKWRREGLASKLILAMETKAAEFNISEMFALTDLPILYHKLGWITVEEHRDGTVVSKKLREESMGHC